MHQALPSGTTAHRLPHSPHIHTQMRMHMHTHTHIHAYARTAPRSPSSSPLPQTCQVSIVPILKGGARCNRHALAAEAHRICDALRRAGVRAVVDGRSCVPGIKFGSSERRGVPLRVEVCGQHFCPL